jgi:hypothetical protein
VIDRLNLAELMQTFKAIAIANALAPTEASLYRNFCRKYSVAFHTPLHVVEKMHPEHVLLNVFEHQLDEMDVEENLETLLQQIYQIEDPEYDAKEEEDLQEFMALAEEEEKERVAMGERVGKKAKKVELPADLPKEGSINFAALQDSRDER